MYTMNINEQELIMLREVCDQHEDVLDNFMKPLTRGQQHQLRVLRVFIGKLKNLSSRDSDNV